MRLCRHTRYTTLKRLVGPEVRENLNESFLLERGNAITALSDRGLDLDHRALPGIDYARPSLLKVDLPLCEPTKVVVQNLDSLDDDWTSPIHSDEDHHHNVRAIHFTSPIICASPHGTGSHAGWSLTSSHCPSSSFPARFTMSPRSLITT